MNHGVAADVLTQDLGGVIDALRPRKFDGLAEFLDPLVAKRKHLVEEALLNRAVGDELVEPHLRRCELGRGFLKIGLKFRPQCRKIAALCAFGPA